MNEYFENHDAEYEQDRMFLEGDPEIEDEVEDEEDYDEDEDVASWVDDSMDGDHESALASIGWGMDEDYGYYGERDYGEDY